MQMAGMLYQVLTQIIVQMLTMSAMPIFWAVAVLPALQAGFTQMKNQKQVVAKLPAFLFALLECWLWILLSGMLGGIIASSLFLLTGISISHCAMLYLWIVMIFLRLLEPRFYCFAYAGGFLVLAQTIAAMCGIRLFDFDGEALLVLVAILHFTEAVMVRISGALQQNPVYFRKRTGTLTAKIQLQMCWPVPLVIPMPMLQNTAAEIYNGYLVMPEWWPLFGTTANAETAVIYQLMPILALIGYRDTAEPGKERMQTRKSSKLLFLYSVMLCMLVLAVKLHPYMQGIAALFAVLGHEGMLWLGSMPMRKYVHIRKKQRFAKFIIKKR